MKAHRRAKAQQAYPSSKQAPMLFPLPDLKSERKESSYFPRITHEVYELSDPQELRGDRTSAKALDRSVDAGRLGSAVRSAASVLRVIERQGNNPRTGRYIEKKPSNEGH
ncbi:hypothetical protein V6N13_109251 [Hibiscus sabdariffa]